ncbi:MAG: hypothetical protein BGO74_04050 [Burkholderiales bacterium 68-12]|nr:MAG: hypothetical protein BGO74_04050 [Burkholderiales bacterium 68-12]
MSATESHLVRYTGRISALTKQRQPVDVRGAEGLFEYQGRNFKSLTAVARHITGAHWSGPLFFGLSKGGAR